MLMKHPSIADSQLFLTEVDNESIIERDINIRISLFVFKEPLIYSGVLCSFGHTVISPDNKNLLLSEYKN